MDKKELKWYEAPTCDVVELKLQGVLCASGDDVPGGKEDDPEFED